MKAGEGFSMIPNLLVLQLLKKYRKTLVKDYFERFVILINYYFAVINNFYSYTMTVQKFLKMKKKSNYG